MSDSGKTLRRIGVALFAGVGGLFVSLACGDSSGPSERACPGAQTVRMHFVNSTNTPGLRVSAAYDAGNEQVTCGPVNLPVQDDQGNLELAQLLIEGAVGDVISLGVINEVAVVASVQCRITTAAEPQGSATRLQTFALVFGGAPPQVFCDAGLETVTP